MASQFTLYRLLQGEAHLLCGVPIPPHWYCRRALGHNLRGATSDNPDAHFPCPMTLLEDKAPAQHEGAD